MRATRAYIAGIGTTGALLAAAACIFAIASAIVAYSAWPADHFAQRSGSVVAPDGLRLAGAGPLSGAGEPLFASALPAGAAAAAGAGGAGAGAG
ncbi:hypothetical protein, partial [Conexibacter sp. CPCC 205762]